MTGPYDKKSGDLGDCAAKSLLEAYGDDPKDPEYIDSILRAILGSMYVGQDHATSCVYMVVVLPADPVAYNRRCGVGTRLNGFAPSCAHRIHYP